VSAADSAQSADAGATSASAAAGSAAQGKKASGADSTAAAGAGSGAGSDRASGGDRKTPSRSRANSNGNNTSPPATSPQSSAPGNSDTASAAGIDCANPGAKPPDFRLERIYGKNLQDATNDALDAGYLLRAVEVEGKPQPVPDDGNLQRINVSVERGAVAGYCGLG
jgi:hypothetical protein